MDSNWKTRLQKIWSILVICFYLFLVVIILSLIIGGTIDYFNRINNVNAPLFVPEPLYQLATLIGFCIAYLQFAVFPKFKEMKEKKNKKEEQISQQRDQKIKNIE